MRKRAIAALAVGAGILLTGCSSAANYQEVRVPLEDGRTVLCLYERANGGVSCDWNNAK